MLEYAALVASPGALPDGLILVFQHPVKDHNFRSHIPFLRIRFRNSFFYDRWGNKNNWDKDLFRIFGMLFQTYLFCFFVFSIACFLPPVREFSL
jgi:hypothetical protein